LKTDTVFKRAFNRMLDHLAEAPRGSALQSENDLSGLLTVSRTTVRKVIAELEERGVVRTIGRGRMIARTSLRAFYFPETETEATSSQVERRFMEWMLREDPAPGTGINELELARIFGVGTTGIREFLNRFSRFGLIEKRPNSGWIFKGFTAEFGLELYEVRELFELRSATAFSRQPASSPLWERLKVIKAEHKALLKTIETNFHDFSDLDNRFHRLINEAAPNRFIDDFYDIITFIFHYHYQWNKQDEKQRNQVAIREHLAYIDALLSRDETLVQSACRAHLASAKTTLMRAMTR
jgi:DNA-binding GntR family transcriptional regulator